jgi:alginate O-acetyltransferase complex protein AlgI
LLQVTLYILIFLTAVIISARKRDTFVWRWMLLAGSYVLYLTWSRWFVAVLLGSTLVNFAVGGWLRRRQAWPALSLGIVFNLGLLGAFKYLPEMGVSGFAHWAMPLGLSFWTFQAMGYLFDQYRGEELGPSLPEFALYMAFFPVTISGPVCRMPDMLPQFRSAGPACASDRERGFSRIAIGVLMMQLGKLLGQGILAGDGIHSGFDRAQQWSGPDVWCLAVGFGLQLFFDFAGYSHIAIGAAQMMGIRIPENFDRPFGSETPSVFWTRWHMSLSFWIRDYVFLPLAMMGRSMVWRNLVLVIAMALFGLWHKASCLFLIWGCYHGALLVAHRQIQQLQKQFDWKPPEPLWTLLSWATTMALVSLGWIFFRANSLSQAQQMLTAVFSPASYAMHYLSGSLYLLVLALAAGYAVALALGDALKRQSESGQTATSGALALLANKRWYWLPPLYVLFLAVVLMVTLTQTASTAQFMYRAF